jgi:CRISPR-associated endoribonuclease Cas6
MPYSLVVEFFSNENINDKFFSNSDINAFALKFIKVSDPELATEFHEQKVNKGITVNKLFQKNNLLGLRLTLLDENLFDRFANVIINSCIPGFTLNKVELKVSKITCSEQAEKFWARYTPYAKIYESASRVERKLNFRITTPLAFKSGDNFVLLPLPDFFFNSLYRRWNEFSDIKLNENLLELIKTNISISGFNNLRTQKVMVKGNKITGTVGDVEYKILGDSPEDFIYQVNILANFAYFSGVGIKTAMGMGQVYRLSEPSFLKCNEKQKNTFAGKF